MAWNRGELFGRHNGRSFLSLLSLMLSTGGTLFWTPLLTIAQENPDKPSIYFPIYAYLCLLNPINFYFNILLLFLDFMTHAGKPEGMSRETFLNILSPPVFLIKQLPYAAYTASFATLVLSAPLFVHAAVSEDSISFAIGASLVCLSLITILSYVLQKLLISGGFVLVLFSLSISTGSLFSFDLFSSLPGKIQDVLLTHRILVHLPLSSVSFVAFTLSIVFVILNIGAPSASHAKNFVIVSLSAAIASVLVGWYLTVYAAVAMAAVVVKTGEF